MGFKRLAFTGICTFALAGGMTALVAERATSDQLGGKQRYLTHVSTDKPIYRPGETVYVRGVILNAIDSKPLEAKSGTPAAMEIVGPKGDQIAMGIVQTSDSVAGFKWKIPDELPGGQYTVKVRHPSQGYAPGERQFDIRAFRAPRLKTQIVFIRDGYGPGDEVGATLHVDRAEGGVPAGAAVTVSARVDGEEVYRGDASVDDEGNCSTKFKLPDEIVRGEGTLAMTVDDNGVVETATKTIPILLRTVDLALYPEGGDLVVGLASRVYFEARTPAKKPADIAGVIVDDQGRPVTDFRSEHEGRGRFLFTPQPGGKYTLKITEPAGITTTYPLPDVRNEGAVIRAVEDVAEAGSPIRLRVGSTSAGELQLSLMRREVEVASAKVPVTAGQLTDVTLTPARDVEGVLIATLTDDQGRPLAERLVYRRPAETINIDIRPDRKQYVPGGKATLNIRTTDAKGDPVSAVVGLTVTDDSVREMIETREHAPRLPVMVLLENDVRELADAHVYLDESDEQAPLALDLLLGTQGWRRFALMDTEAFIKVYGDKARRVLAQCSPEQERQRAQWYWRRLGAARGGGMGGMGGMPGGMVDVFEGNDAIDLLARADADGDKGAVADGVDLGLAMPAERPPAAADMPVAEHEPRPADPVAGVKAKELERDNKPLAALRAPRRDMEDRLRALDGDEMGEIAAEEMAVAASRYSRGGVAVFREYAHQVRPDRKPGDRVDFTETVYWHAGVRTDDKTGEASVTFGLSDAVTAFRVLADGFTSSGALGQADTLIESVEPFYVEPKLPLEVTSGDIVELPVGVVAGVEGGVGDVSVVIATADGVDVQSIEPFSMGNADRTRKIVRMDIGDLVGTFDFTLDATAGDYADRVTRKLVVKPSGFPIDVAAGGLLSPGGQGGMAITIPKAVVPNSVTASVTVYPTPLASLTQSLERLIREPNGCFEQTSSTAYPLVMAQQYFMSHTGVDPALITRSQAMLDKAYARLTGFECKQKGYEWFGSDPGHEALTAYGLLEFTDMGQVREVDVDMVGRTREWLLKRRDGKGGYNLDSKAIDTFGRAPADTTHAYITWALLQAGQTGLDQEVDAVTKLATETDDTYVIALAANALASQGDRSAAAKLMQRLTRQQDKDGAVQGAETSITRSGGQALTIETTALAVLAWLTDDDFAPAVEVAMRYLSSSCEDGRFGSTQSTILALKAIIAYDKSRAHPTASGHVQVFVDDRPIGEPVPFDEDTQGALSLPDVRDDLTVGDHEIEVRMSDGSRMPYSIAVSYHALTPASSKECRVALNVRLSDEKVTEGDVTEANVTMTNLVDEIVSTPVAIIGLPAGLEPRHDQLKELVKAGKIDAYEVIGREVVCYWRALKPQQRVTLPISCVAEVPGTYTGPASRGYEYYTDEFKHWNDGLKVMIAPREGR